MRRYVVLEKKRGETPLMALNAWRSRNPQYADVPATYAGRLDPMAEGKLLILLGEECKKQERYTNLDKEYVIDVLFDVGSDTGDALGLVELAKRETRVDFTHLKNAFRAEKGVHERPYPAFSSKVVHGKPLFLHALEGTIGMIPIPLHTERIYEIERLSSTLMSAKELKEYVHEFLSLVPRTNEPSKRLGEDFRIDAVRDHWEAVFRQAGNRRFVTVRLRVVCGSGTYMRALAERLGKVFHTKALALSIRRTKIGKRMGTWWLKTYK